MTDWCIRKAGWARCVGASCLVIVVSAALALVEPAAAAKPGATVTGASGGVDVSFKLHERGVPAGTYDVWAAQVSLDSGGNVIGCVSQAIGSVEIDGKGLATFEGFRPFPIPGPIDVQVIVGASCATLSGAVFVSPVFHVTVT